MIAAKLLLNLKWKGLAPWQGANTVNYIFIAAYLVFLAAISSVALSTSSMVYFYDRQNITVFDPKEGKNITFDSKFCGLGPGNDSVNPWQTFCSLDEVYDYMRVSSTFYG